MIKGSPLCTIESKCLSIRPCRSSLLSKHLHADFGHRCAWIRSVWNLLDLDDVQLLLGVPQSVTAIAVASGEVHTLIVPANRFHFLLIDIGSIVAVRRQIPVNDQLVLVANQDFVIVGRMLNDGLHGTWMDDSTATVLDDPEKDRFSLSKTQILSIAYVFSMISVGMTGVSFKENVSILNE
jgi:hypothetical protein